MHPSACESAGPTPREPELDKLIEDAVKSGRSFDPNEFLNKAIHHYVMARDLGEEHSPAVLHGNRDVKRVLKGR